MISKLAGANRDRHESTDADWFNAKLGQCLAQGIYALVSRLSVETHLHHVHELATLCPTMPQPLTSNAIHQALTQVGEPTCRRCKYSLRGLAPNGSCPECGEAYHSNVIGWDLTAGQLHRYVDSKADMNCKPCGYSLIGLATQGRCPECGVKFKTGNVDWATFSQLVAGDLAMAPEQIKTDTFIIAQMASVYQRQIQAEIDSLPHHREQTDDENQEDQNKR